jgi:hypothetical protein
MELIYWPGAGCHNSTPFRIAGPDEDAAETLDPLHDSSEIPPGTDL